ncbi:MAG: hypothetical protein ABR950_04500 [Candidatus Dormibacteria bacterium]
MTVTSAPLPSALEPAETDETRTSNSRPPRAPHRLPVASPGPRLPGIHRPEGLLPAARPGDVPQPQHLHLPGWVRRAHGQARPILADLIGNLSGEPRQQYSAHVAALIEGMSSGKFSLAWQYPALIDEGWALVGRQRADAEEEAKRRRGLESARRKVADQLRDAGARLTPETATRLNRTLRSADGPDAIKEVAVELDHAVAAVRTLEERRRDREIDRTRERLRRSLPRGADAEGPAETWQDSLRRIAEQYSE